jgi:hypothetical protein
MKKIILAAALTVTIGTTFALDSGVSTPAGTQPLAHLPHDYNSTATIVKFNMDLELTNGDDDIYFQGGKIYCEIDTDEVVGVSSPKVSIKKGETRIVKDVQEQYHSATHSYEVDLDLSASEYAFIDELECSIPASNMRDILVKDLLEVTGGAITLEYLSLETFK